MIMITLLEYEVLIKIMHLIFIQPQPYPDVCKIQNKKTTYVASVHQDNLVANLMDLMYLASYFYETQADKSYTKYCHWQHR